ncbi:DNA repair protein RecN [bacterium]|nr:DNA repair protein RecN [bacterium]
MLKWLKIKNLAVIEDLEIEFREGFNVLTGETGAGKSLIIGAIETLLGERSDPAFIRSGKGEMMISASFRLDKHLQKAFSKYGIDGDELVIHRIIKKNANNQTRINNEIASVSTAQQIGKRLVDILGQHQHQSLLEPDFHLEVLDAFAGITGKVEDFRESYREYREISQKLQSLERQKKRMEELAELRTFQMEEITRAGLRPEEEEELKEKIRIMDNLEQLIQVSNTALSGLYEEDYSAYNQLSEINKQLTKLINIDAKLKEPTEYLDTACNAINECISFLNRYTGTLEYDPGAAEEARSRLAYLGDLKMKYKRSIPELIDFCQGLCREEEDFSRLNKEIETVFLEKEKRRTGLQEGAEAISEHRLKAANEITSALSGELSELALENLKFKVNFTYEKKENSDFSFENEPTELFPDGFDRVEFLISLNVGEELRPLHKIVSGGELSRIMLGFKSILAERDHLPVLIFDEIDAGVGGITASRIGAKLKKLEKSHQIIVISHLHQIASQAGTHFMIEKYETGDRTQVKVYQVNGEARVNELTRMIGLEKDKKYAREVAADLLKSTSS